MAAKKVTKPKKKHPYVTVQVRRTAREIRFRVDPDYRWWRTWTHDLDTILHELVKNPALATLEPSAVLERAEAFADAYEALQARRRPASVTAMLSAGGIDR